MSRVVRCRLASFLARCIGLLVCGNFGIVVRVSILVVSIAWGLRTGLRSVGGGKLKRKRHVSEVLKRVGSKRGGGLEVDR